MPATQFAIFFDQGPSNEWRVHLIKDPAVRPSGGTRSTFVPYFRNGADRAANLAVSGATNVTPIVLTVPTGHGIVADDYVRVTDVGGNTAANGDFRVSAVGATTVTLEDSAGNGAYTSGGNIQKISGINLNILEVAAIGVSALANERSAGN